MHPATEQLLRYFDSSHLTDHLRPLAREFEEFARDLFEYHDLNGPEATVGLRKLLEAKDCFVRASLTSEED